MKIESLIANYGRTEALHGISLEVREHEIVASIGNNGVGKTTLLSSVSGHVTKEGKIEPVGEDISRLASGKIARKGVLHVPEGRHISPGLTVEQNLLVGTTANKGIRLSVGNNKGDLDYIYDIFPRLLEYRKRLAWPLSGGEQQMLTIGRVIMGHSRSPMLDELSMGLAPLAIDELLERTAEINKSGTPILLAGQNAKLVLKVSDRAYMLERGNISLSGKSRDLINDKHIAEAYLSRSRQGPHNLEGEMEYGNFGGK